MKIKILFVFIIVFTLFSTAYSQNNTKIKPESAFFESLSIPSNAPDSNNVFFFYKIRLSELDFDKSDNLKVGSFSSYPSIEIEIKDNTGIIRKRLNKTDTVTINDYSTIDNDENYYEGFFKTKLTSNNYIVRFIITVNNRDIYDRRVNLDSPQKNDLQIQGNPILVDNHSEDYKPIIFNNAVDLKCEKPTFLFLTRKNQSPSLFASISNNTDSGNKLEDFPTSYNTNVSLISNKSIDFAKYGMSVKGNLIANDSLSLYKIEIPQEMIYPGRFKLQIKGTDKKDTLNFNYDVKWFDIPKSLVNISYSEELMHYILTDVEIAKLRAQKSKDKEAFIYKYWRTLDPTPKTYYNEAMKEYFKRADEAKTKFLTILHNDGALTPRGQIYILYGNPDSISNELSNKKSVEKWVYSKLKKQFIFEITTPGEYKLINIIE